MPRRAASPAPKVIIHHKESFFARPPVVAGVLAVMAVSAVYLWLSQPQPNSPYLIQATWPSKSAQNMKKTGDEAAKRVAQLMVVPTEKPSVYTVTDSAAFQSQSGLLGQVELGDKVFVWADLVVVYSPSKDRISGVMPGGSLTFAGKMPDTEPSSTTSTASTTPETGATVEVRNGSGVNGAASRLKATLATQGLTVSRIGDATTRPEGTLIVDLSKGAAPNTLAAVVNATDGTVVEMPEGEPASTASVLVIIGR